MAKLIFDADGNRRFEMGNDHVVIYPKTIKENKTYYGAGFVFDGATAVSENPSGADENELYADNIKYGSLRAAETFGATLEAYQFPHEFAVLDGTKSPAKGVYFGQQKRGSFGMSYRTKVGNDMDPEAGYKLHLVYNATASPSSKSYSTVNNSPDAITFSWEIATSSIVVPMKDYKPLSTITIDTTELDEEGLAALATLEAALYGTDAAEPYLPLPDEVFTMFGGSLA